MRSSISRELDIVLTSRSKSGDNRVPLAGVPYHAVDGYIAKAHRQGLQGGGLRPGGGPEKREGHRETGDHAGHHAGYCDRLLDASLVCGILPNGPLSGYETRGLGDALLDISTGEFFVTLTGHDSISERNLRDGPVPPRGMHRPVGMNGEIRQRSWSRA